PPPAIPTLSLHDALPIFQVWTREPAVRVDRRDVHLPDVHPRIERGRYLPIRILHFVNPLDWRRKMRLSRTLRIYLVCESRIFLRSEEHTSELQSRGHLVC